MEELCIGMRNFDNFIEDGLEQKLIEAEGTGYSGHAAWDFYGHVYYSDGVFKEDVWIYGVKQITMEANSLRELMNNVNDVYGWG